MIASSGRCSRTSSMSSEASAALAHDLEAGALEQTRPCPHGGGRRRLPARLASGSCSQPTIMGYRDAMGTSAPNADSGVTDRAELERLAEEQSALRRVATLVAQGASSTEVFAAVAQEVAQVLHLSNAAICRFDDEDSTMTVVAVWGDLPEIVRPGSRWPLDGASMSTEILRTGRPARLEDYSDRPGSLATEARQSGVSSAAGAPIIVDGRVWGVISTSSRLALPDQIEDRLAEFTELVATAIANSQAHEDLRRLADEQAALRRVATLVARGVPPAQLFEAVSAEVARLVPAGGAALARYEPDGTVTAVGGWTSTGAYIHVGTPFAPEGTVTGLIFETRQPCAAQLRGRARSGRCRRSRNGLALVGRSADHRRGPPLGCVERRVDRRPAAAPRHRASPGRVHRACSDGDRERRQPCRARRLTRTDRRHRRRDPAADRARPARRRAAAARLARARTARCAGGGAARARRAPGRAVPRRRGADRRSGRAA